MFPLNETKEKQIEFLLNELKIDLCNSNAAELKILTGGITNAIFKLTVNGQKYIVRIFGNNTDEIINRKEELQNIMKIGLTKVYAVFENGSIVSYQEGEPLTPATMASEDIMWKTAALIGQFHSKTRNEAEKHENTVFNKIQNFIDKIDKDSSFSREKRCVKELQERFEQLKDQFTVQFKDSDVVLCHNDLLSGNILSDGKNLSLIDYEYSSYTWPHFDIANHFFEMCGFEIDLNRYPSLENQRKFVKIYLKNYFGEEQSDYVVEKWVKDIGDMVQLTCMYWGTWAYFQSLNSNVEFPYFEYAQKRTIFTKVKLPLSKDNDLLKESPLVKL